MKSNYLFNKCNSQYCFNYLHLVRQKKNANYIIMFYVYERTL